MNKPIKTVFVIASVMVLCGVLIFVLIREQGRNPSNDGDQNEAGDLANEPGQRNDESSDSPPTADENGTPSTEEQREQVVNLFTTAFEKLKQSGVPMLPTAKANLEQAAQSGDYGEVIRAFHDAIYSRWNSAEEVIPLLKQYLNHSDSFVRLSAAKSLLTIGDESGTNTLIEIIRSGEDVEILGEDVRVRAAVTMAKFRRAEAAPAIIALYDETNDGDLLRALATLGIKAPQTEKFPFVPSVSAITSYAKTGKDKFMPNIESVFMQTQDPKLKNTAAWALTYRGKGDYLDYLAEAAQTAIDQKPNGASFYSESSEALRYLGSIQTPAAKNVLENALASQNPVAVRYAVVNLIFNQQEKSETAVNFVIEELRGEHRMLGSELTLNIASKLLREYPEIGNAGSSSDQRSGGRSWQNRGIERENWSIYNWIDDYVVIVNE